jgi:phenylpropionate dioxygenase-like ring-hydroxylating dioxygenase large terminal subunit
MNLSRCNARTQPPRRFKNFNSWESIPRAWYFACRSGALPAGSVQAVTIGRQRLALFRTQSGMVGALDGFCPHMGTDLSKGTVHGDSLRCLFHHWRFRVDGRCVDIPCQQDIPDHARVLAYATAERYGAVWVFPDSHADVPLIEVPGVEGCDTTCAFGQTNREASHHHISMLNGLDAQHLRTVHHIDMDMKLRIDEDRRWVDYTLSGDTPSRHWIEKVVRWLVGPRYSYGMRYAQGSVAALTLMKGVSFKRWAWPELTMLFAYRPMDDGHSLTFPIFVTRKRPGLLGPLVSRSLLTLTRLAYAFLKNEDAVIYNNIRFSPNTLLAIDAGVAHYIQYIETLTPSAWSSDPGERLTMP